MEEIAHRGYAADAPENTVAAVRAASATADAVEVDVRRCGSGEPVVIHDRTVDRVTDATGRVADYDAGTLAGLRVDGTGEGVPTLAAVLDAAEPGTPFVVELKERGLAADVLAVLATRDHPAVLASFDPQSLREVRAAAPERPTALIASRLRDRPVATADRLGCAGVHLHYRLCLVPGLLRAARSAGCRVAAWTVDRPLLVRLLALAGVDGVAVDAAGTVPKGLRPDDD